jgi:6-phosphogluconolactonase (cycloisomerase 2 family)
MKFWKYGRVIVALIGAVVLGLSITCCGVYTSGYMYVTGSKTGGSGSNQSYNQIGAFKIDHDFGYLTPVTGQPFAASGSDPVQEVIIGGGRFLAIVNKGSNSVSLYTIGGAGTLYFQANYSTSGTNPVSIKTDPSGGFLYVVDQNAPPDVVNGVDLNAGRGDITVFQITPSTGKLTLITNANTFNTNGSQLPYFVVNYKPVQAVTSGSYLYVLDQAYTPGASGPDVPAACTNQPSGSPCTTPDVFLYAINPNGQLTLTQNAALAIPNVAGGALSTIYSSGTNVYITNTTVTSQFPSGSILPFTVGPQGVLQTLVGGTVANPSTSSNPDAILASATGAFLYVANFGPGNPTQANSNISPFTVDPTTHQLTPISNGQGSTYTTGSGPIWMAIDSTNQYLYTANFNDNTISAKVLDATHGQLSNIIKGTVATPTVQQPTFVVITGRTF